MMACRIKKLNYDFKDCYVLILKKWVGNGFLIPSGPLKRKIEVAI